MNLEMLLDGGRQATSIMVAPPVSPEDTEFWPHANRHILWGWKRDDGIQSRVVYYSGHLQMHRRGIAVEDSFFFYKHRTFAEPATVLAKQLERGVRVIAKTLSEPSLTLCSDRGGRTSSIFFTVGVPRAEDRDRVRRLLTRRPRKRLIVSSLPGEAAHCQSHSVFPADLYAGSGVSYEAGLPTLCDVHAYFCLDDHENGTFSFGTRDLLPLWLMEDPVRVIINFCHLHTKAISAQPTPAQRVIAALYKRGMIQQVFSDNVDNLLCKVDVPFIRTRGSGVFNERFPAQFCSPTLLVVGVAADRRQLIQQARGKHIRIAVVDPCARVSPGVQHLNYLKSRDLFFRCTAHEFFTGLSEKLLLSEVYHVTRELSDFLQCYREQRDTLYRDVTGLPTELMDWQVAPTAVTVGSSLLHIAGMEYLILGTLAGVSLQDLRHAEQWKIFVRGFPRELATIPPHGNPVTYYLAHLQELEQRTVSLLTHAVRGFLDRKSLFYASGREFQDEFLVMTSIRELVLSLLEHAEYHRGQITLLKFLFSRLNRATSRSPGENTP